MIIYRNPKRTQWGEITSRPRLDLAQLNETVTTVLNNVRQRGDEAVKEYELKFDKAALTSLAVSEQEMQEAEQLVSAELKAGQASAVGRKVSPLSVLDCISLAALPHSSQLC